MNLFSKLLYKRKKWYVKRTNRYHKKYRMAFRNVEKMWYEVKDINTMSLHLYLALDTILIDKQKSFRLYYFNDDDVFDMIKILEEVRNKEHNGTSYVIYQRTLTSCKICFKLINDLRITNPELYVKYKLLLK